jgi:hypothetical protein
MTARVHNQQTFVILPHQHLRWPKQFRSKIVLLFYQNYFYHLASSMDNHFEMYNPVEQHVPLLSSN